MRGVPGKRIVVADDDPSWVELISNELVLEGHVVVASCTSGEAAIEACVAHQPDALVVDERMPPGLNGLEVARRLRASQPGVTVVLFTNYEDEETVKGAVDLGAVFVLKGNLQALRAALTLD
jgi:CheY-like chemotaxis protein